MRCWLITVGEPLPLPGEHPRLLRTGRLALHLRDAGHTVLWWSSTFDHSRKRHVRPGPTTIPLGGGLTLRLLHGRSYRRNVSLARLVNHHQVAAQFRLEALREAPPDVVLCSFPTIELADEAVAYAGKRSVPIALDVRDLWPDIFAEALPGPLRWPARLALRAYQGRARRALRRANAVVGVSEGYLNWALRKAGRSRRPTDMVAPLGYEPAPTLAPDIEAAVRAHLRAKGVDFTRPLLWFVGTFGRTYDLAPVLAAARGLAEAGVAEPLFVLSGDGERGPLWRPLSADLRNVVFTGWLGRDEITVLLQTATLGLAAYAEGAPQGLPNKIFEYMSAGLPIVSSLRGETEILLQEAGCGITYDPSQPEALRDALRSVLADAPRRARMGAAARATFARHFAADQIDGALTAWLVNLAASRQADP